MENAPKTPKRARHSLLQTKRRTEHDMQEELKYLYNRAIEVNQEAMQSIRDMLEVVQQVKGAARRQSMDASLLVLKEFISDIVVAGESADEVIADSQPLMDSLQQPLDNKLKHPFRVYDKAEEGATRTTQDEK